jgi:uncharacterized protein (TIGR04255 family)
MPPPSSDALPSFRQPPVTEVVLNVQLAPLTEFQAVHFGLFWESIRSQFPTTETKPPIDQQSELQEIGKANLSVEVLNSIPMPRVWFVSPDQTRLIQVQTDRLIYNWRQAPTGEDYPRFPAIKEGFLRAYDSFESFVVSNKLGEFIPVQAEVSYINQLPLNGQVTTFGDLGSVFRFWSRPTSDLLGIPEHAALRMSFRLGTQEEFRGRLHVAVEPRFRRNDSGKLLQLTMTARGPLRTADRQGVAEFISFGRKYVVQGFADLTTKTLQEVWERIDA